MLGFRGCFRTSLTMLATKYLDEVIQLVFCCYVFCQEIGWVGVPAYLPEIYALVPYGLLNP